MASGGQLLTPMPFMADSTYRNMQVYFDEAFKRANPPYDPDREFDLEGHAVAHFFESFVEAVRGWRIECGQGLEGLPWRKRWICTSGGS